MKAGPGTNAPCTRPVGDAREERPFACSRRSPFGPVAILWSVHGGRPFVMRVLLSRPGAAADGLVRPLFPGIAEASCPEIDAVADLIGAFLEGGDIRFSLDVVRMDLASAFQRRVLEAEHAIPRGSVSTYGRIASHLGIPSGARAVGTALATNPFPIIVPCHRSVRSDGMLGGFQGGLAMKAALLRMEGVSVAEKGRVEDAIFHY